MCPRVRFVHYVHCCELRLGDAFLRTTAHYLYPYPYPYNRTKPYPYPMRIRKKLRISANIYLRIHIHAPLSLRNYTCVFTFFFQNPKTRLITFLNCCTRFLKHWSRSVCLLDKYLFTSAIRPIPCGIIHDDQYIDHKGCDYRPTSLYRPHTTDPNNTDPKRPMILNHKS